MIIMAELKERTTKDRLFEIQADLKHMKMRLDQMYGLVYKIQKEGLKVKR